MDSVSPLDPIRFPFDERKAAAAAAYVLSLEGGQMDYLRLIKLLYLAERESLARFGRPIVGDTYYSLDHGPILTRVLDLIKHPTGPGPWADQIQVAGRYAARLKKEPDLGPLSEAEIELLKEAVTVYQMFDRWHLRDLSHGLPEWKDPGGTRIEITVEEILQVLGKTPEQIEEIRKNARELTYFDSIFGR